MTSGADLGHLTDPNLEELVLGSVLQLGEPAFREVERLTIDDFGLESHRVIFGAMRDVASEVSPTIDAVCNRLQELGRLDAAGGLTGLVVIDGKALPGIHLNGFARTLRRLSNNRRAYRLKERLARELECGITVNADAIRAIGDELQTLEDGFDEMPARTFGQCLEEAGGIDELCAPPQNLVPIAWENQLVRGFQAGQLIVAAGRTSAGKTVIGAQQAAHAAKLGHRTLFASLEMSVPEMLKRFLAMIARVRHADLQNGDLHPTQRRMVTDAAARLATWPLEITTHCRTLDSIRAKVSEERKRSKPYQLVVVDYLQLLTAGDFENRTQEVSAISRGLKLCALENDCVVLALSQLSRASESRPGDNRPRLSDLRDSGSIEQDANMVLFIHRPELYKPNDPSLRNKAEMIIGKQRSGAIGSFDLVWVPQFVTFSERPQAEEVPA